MLDSDKEQMAYTLAGLASVFGRELDEPAFYGYWVGMKDLELSAFTRAAEKAIKTCDRMPTVAQLRHLAGVPRTDAKAVIAWAAASRAAASIGPYKHVDFDDRTTNAAIRNLGGWPSFCSRFTGAEDEKWLRIEFLKAYQSLDGKADGDLGNPLPGLVEQEIRGGALVAPVPRQVNTGLGLPGPDRRRIAK